MSKAKRRGNFGVKYQLGSWSEGLQLKTFNLTPELFCLPYGPSGSGPNGPNRPGSDYQKYWDLLTIAGNDDCLKRPDHLIFHAKNQGRVMRIVAQFGGIENLAFVPESYLSELLSMAIAAIECEASSYVTARMKGYKNQSLKPYLMMARPNLILKQEDVERLQNWQDQHNIPLFISHLFFDNGWLIKFDTAIELIQNGIVQLVEAGERMPKHSYLIPFQYSVHLGQIFGTMVKSKITESSGGKHRSSIVYEGGELSITVNAVRYIMNG